MECLGPRQAEACPTLDLIRPDVGFFHGKKVLQPSIDKCQQQQIGAELSDAAT